MDCMPESFRQAFQLMDRSKTVTETLQVPARAVLELYTRIDTLAGLEGKPGAARARHEVLTFLESTIPYLKGLDYTIDTSHALHPVVRVTGTDNVPKAGSGGVLEAYEIPNDQLFEFFEKHDLLTSGTKVGRYEFWKFVEELFKVDTTRSWKIRVSPVYYGLVLYAKDEILRKAEQDAAAQ